MAKFSEIFGRKAAETDPARPLVRGGNGNGHGEHISVESMSDMGSRMGEQNEALRNLLSDTGCKMAN